MKGLTNIEHSFTEREEIEIFRLGRALAESVGRHAFLEFLLQYAVNNEADVRAKLPHDSALVQDLDEYHKRVSMGLREPLIIRSGLLALNPLKTQSNHPPRVRLEP